ncbi:DEAD/DEAH box helicase, partial [filamentous cyanobacterium CCP5]
QMERTQAVEAMVDNHPARQWENPNALLKRQKRVNRLEQELADRQTKLSEYTGRYWQEFLDIMAVLQHFDALADTAPTRLGEMAAAIRGDNELWLGLVLDSEMFDHLAPPQLAAACAALVTENSRPDSWCDYAPSKDVEDALGGLRSLRRELMQQQHRRRLAVPVWMEYDLVGLVEQWANQVEWPELCQNTSLDEGDIVRILRRTLDFLSQIPHVPYLSGQIRGTVREAIVAMNRFPVNEEIG